MKSYDLDFQAFRRDWLHRFKNMDPDDLICELAIDTDTLMDALWLQIERHIEQEYTNDEDERDGVYVDDDDGI